MKDLDHLYVHNTWHFLEKITDVPLQTPSRQRPVMQTHNKKSMFAFLAALPRSLRRSDQNLDSISAIAHGRFAIHVLCHACNRSFVS
jgi:hypothetical protein